MPFPQGGRGPAVLGTVVRCFGENAATKHSPCKREAHFAAPGNTRDRDKALFSNKLRIPAGRPAQESRNTYGTGATPQKTALACASGPFGEVAPGNLPCRKAGPARRAAEAFTEGIRTIVVALQVGDPRRGPGLSRQRPRFRGMLLLPPHVNLAYSLNRL